MAELVAGNGPTREFGAERGPTSAPVLAPVLVGWGALWSAITLNVSQVFLLDSSEGLSEPALLPVAAAAFLAELWLFGRAVHCLSPVIAYAAYGATPAVVTILSVSFFGEALTLAKLAGVGAITAGVVLLATEGTPAPRASCAENIAPASATPGPAVDPSQPSLNQAEVDR
jgi:multidrug transporter EmrE-like cation transporter